MIGCCLSVSAGADGKDCRCAEQFLVSAARQQTALLQREEKREKKKGKRKKENDEIICKFQIIATGGRRLPEGLGLP